jgi:ABC-type nitrate/sulfonate/bicarbonate transport system substrate-binding protein
MHTVPSRVSAARLLALLLALGLLVSACGGGQADTGTAAEDTPAPAAGATAGAGNEDQEEGGTAGGEIAQMKWQNCVAVVLPAVAPLLLGNATGFFEEEGIAVTYDSSPGSTGQCIQLVAAGQADFTFPVIEGVLLPAAEGNDTGLVYAYNLTRRPIYQIAVPPDGSIASYADLEGKSVGIHAQGSAVIPFFEVAMREAGADPSTVQYVVTGFGAQAAEALARGQVQGLLYWDYEFATHDTLGYERDYLPNPTIAEDLFSSGIAFSRDYLEEHPDRVEGYLRALTKSLIFADENPRATVCLHWQNAPESKPQDVSDEEALRSDMAILESRLPAYLPEVSEADPRWGAYTQEQWEAYAEYLGVGGEVDVSTLYTNDFVDAANDVDEEAVREMARSYEVEGCPQA